MIALVIFSFTNGCAHFGELKVAFILMYMLYGEIIER